MANIFSRRKSPRVTPISTAFIDNDLTDRLVLISRAAREKLQPLAEIERDEVRISKGPHSQLGSHESVGLLLMLAKLNPERPTKEEVEEYLREGQTGISQALDFVAMCLVILTLCMSIEAPMIVYALMAFDTADPSLGAGAVTLYGYWTQPSVAHALHWAECAFMALSLTYALRGIQLGFMLYSSLALYLPEMEDKLRFALEMHRTLMNMWVSGTCTMLWFFLALPFVAARVSPVASFCAVCPLAVFCMHFRFGLFPIAMIGAKLQVDNAKRLLYAKKRPTSGPTSTPCIAFVREAPGEAVS